MSPEKVQIGNNVFLNSDVKIGGQLGVEIGNDVLISYNVNIVSEDHLFQNSKTLIRKQGYTGGTIVIHDDVWIGANSVILPKLVIGKGAVVGANSVVTRDVPPYTVVAGIPAKPVKLRLPLKRT